MISRLVQQPKNRRGSVLVVVLILVILLSLAAYKYTQSMITEFTSAGMYGRRLQTTSFADSGVEAAADFIGNRTFEPEENLIHDEAAFSGVSMQTGEVAQENGFYTIIAANERDPDWRSVRYGLVSESGKLNLNNLLRLEQLYVDVDEDGTDTGTISVEFYDILASIPGLDDQTVVDSILDWLDEDDDPRPFGAENTYYMGLDSGYECKNGPIESFDELLQIQGVTASVLYGEDGNRNGLLDANENDGDSSLPSDDENGILNLGLIGYCTIRSTETNLRGDGSDRINLNQGLMTELFDAIAEEFDEETAQFVVAFRLYGSVDAVADEDGSSLTVSQEEVATAVGNAIGGDVEGDVTRGGLDLTQPAAFEFVALFDLVDAEIEAEIDGVPTTLVSPWQSGGLSDMLPVMFDTFSLTDDALIDNRIDPNYARMEVLMTVPGLLPDAAEAIAASSIVNGDGSAAEDLVSARSTPGWLYVEDIVDLETMREIEPYLTTRGDIFKVQVLGYFEEGGPFSRVEAMIDGTEYPAKVIGVSDLTGLGRGYTNEHLGLETEATTR